MNRTFWKMHGLGNDFVIIDVRQDDDFVPTREQLIAISDRRRGIGCDQIVFMHHPRTKGTAIYLDMYNCDASPQYACGNVTRCVARLLCEEFGTDQVVIETKGGLLACVRQNDGMITVDFSEPRLKASDLGVHSVCDTLHLPLSAGESFGLYDPCGVSMGNPHAVFFVPDVQAVALGNVGPVLENDPLFSDRCNIEVAQIFDCNNIRMRVWERGAGITEACGSGACATLVAAVRRGLSSRKAAIHMPGGTVTVEWREHDGHVLLTGAVSKSYQGIMDADMLPI